MTPTTKQPFHWNPQWNEAQFKLFDKLLGDAAFHHGGWMRRQGGIILFASVFIGEPRQYSIVDLAQNLENRSTEDWKDIIFQHFDTIVESEKENREMKEKLSDWDEARARLKLRLRSDSVVPTKGDAPMRCKLPGTVSVPMLELAYSAHDVTRKEVDRWGISDDEVFDAAYSNLKNMVDLPRFVAAGSQDYGDLFAVEAASIFTASLAFLIEQYWETIGDHGAFVGVPSQHVIFFSPLTSTLVDAAVNDLQPMVDSYFKSGPGSISPHLYWYRHGEFTVLEVDRSGNEIELIRTDEMQETLKKILGV